jgi:Zn-dependent protease
MMAGAFLQGGLPVLLPAALLGLGLTATVGLHELGHAVAAQRYGYPTSDITLYVFGGIASIEATDEMADHPDQELVIALAGPAVNFALVVVFGWATLWTGPHPVLAALVSMNLMMGLFNLIPAYPMDGGRILRALLAKRMGWLPASKLAMKVGWGFVGVFAIVSVVWRLPSLLMVAGFLVFVLRQERERLVAEHFQRSAEGRAGTGWSSRNAGVFVRAFEVALLVALVVHGLF